MPTMANTDRESTLEERPTERRHRTKAEKEASRAHKSSRSSRPKIDPETGEPVKSSHRRRKEKSEKDTDSQKSASMADLVPELARTASAPGATSRSSLPYPSFNKAFSKEAVVSREDFGVPLKSSPYTPESTDVGSDEKQRSKSAEQPAPTPVNTTKDGRPPSPPETEMSDQKRPVSSRTTKLKGDEASGSRRSSHSGRSKVEDDGRSKLSMKSKISDASTAVKTSRAKSTSTSERGHRQADESYDGESDSNLTSVATKKASPPNINTHSSQDSARESSPRTPTQTPKFPPPPSEGIKPAPSPFMPFERPSAESSAFDSPQPPPPPPPPNVPASIPQVDYLLLNGGLPRVVPKTMISATPGYVTTSGQAPLAQEIERIFGPYHTLLSQYETVMKKNGSIAVATGYKSIARRLLDRLEIVFNRDISTMGCVCVMCQNSDYYTHEGVRGLGWGEVLEWVGGRRELPPFPAFDFATLGIKSTEELAGLGISGYHPMRPGSPIKIDPDVAEEYREHYLQQSKKSRVAVNKWLSSCPQAAVTPPPQEVDDETLSFAILTHLDSSERPKFNALMSGSSVLLPASRAPTPLRKPRSDFIAKTVGAIQRLYRLPVAPRDPEAAIYLLKNPDIHNLISTLSGINVSEWEILISGRFEGFLWSGSGSEEAFVDTSPAQSRGPTPSNATGYPSRGPMSPAFRQAASIRSQTFSPSMGSLGGISRGSTPSQSRHNVSNDEESEIAALAEVEREIYLGMEMLEDAFEALHRKAELVRRAMRERSAGLSMSLQSRRTSQPDIISSGTPGPASAGLGYGYERPSWADGGSEVATESEWDNDDELQSELAPDDSASNISSSRYKRPKRRNERRTPALVEEEDED